ncbi:MAG: asparagine synthase (glutamine-hydrolyzing) [Deltaproteobacteria bacterium]|nr:asparagine synthase (glutamine-hydrolyzing) [Deltaproteobacteria bacterium]
MSGICGIVLNDQRHPLSARSLAPMVAALDISGRRDGFVETSGATGIGAQTFPGRLAGVLKTPDEHLVLGFHGSLYKTAELSIQETPDQNPFAAFIELYLKEGMAFVRRLRGEFALAIWDGRTETVYLATDRFRVHPLYYYQDQEKLVFGSLMKSVVACPFPVKKSLDPEAIIDVAASSFVSTPKTIFREVKKLAPAHVLTYSKGRITTAPYWEISFLNESQAGERALTRNLKGLLSDALAVRLRTDGESSRIGTFLSGGVDSSTVTGVLTKLTKAPIKSFSIGFAEQGFNEINYARISARAFGSEHHEYFVTAKDVADAMPVLLKVFDEPFANASAIPTYFCAKTAAERGVEFLYAGDGGDELFAGNERYATQRLFDYYTAVPLRLRELFLKPAVFALADRLGHELFVKGKKYIQRAEVPYPDRLTSYGLFHVLPMAELLEGDILNLVGSDYDRNGAVAHYYRRAPARTELDRQLYIDLKLAISDNDLVKVIRMTEAAGVAARFPFLDHPLAEFAATIPAAVKMKGRELRSFFKNAYSDLLPFETRAKKKHGFGLPIPIWLRTDKMLNEMIHDLVLSSRSLQRGYFRRKALERLVENHKTDQTSFFGTIIWNLMILELWLREVYDPLAAVQARSLDLSQR